MSGPVLECFIEGGQVEIIVIHEQLEGYVGCPDIREMQHEDYSLLASAPVSEIIVFLHDGDRNKCIKQTMTKSQSNTYSTLFQSSHKLDPSMCLSI